MLRLAKLVAGNVDGFVCSPEELKPLRRLYPDKLLVPAGIRSPGKATHDQSRVGTSAEEIAHGATHLVMGRQILEAPDPVCEARRIMLEELGMK